MLNNTNHVRFIDRKGSVVTSLELEFAASPSMTNEALLHDLQRAVSSGNVSDLVVDENHPLSEELKTGTDRNKINAYYVKGKKIITVK